MSNKSERGSRQLAIDAEKLAACVHCGFCLPACPTHIITGEEMPSPRGRLYLMRLALDGRVAIDDPALIEHERTCLVCRACETACPSGVEFGFLMEQTRDEMRAAQPEQPLRRWIYSKLLPNRQRLNWLQQITALAEKAGLIWLTQKLGQLLPVTSKLGSAMRLAPNGVQLAKDRPIVYPAIGERKGAVALLLGCLGEVFTSRINDATVAVLTACGYDVHILPNLVCCGALQIHGGYRNEALELAKKAIETLEKSDVTHLLTNIAGCGAMLKDYEKLFATTESASAATLFRSKVRDISEFLHENALKSLARLLVESELTGTIAWQAPCHLLHGQRIVDAPRELLRLIPKANVIDFPENELCCGSAGSYNIEQPDWSAKLLKRKVEYAAELRPDIIATANAGCLMQLQKGIREAELPIRTMHVIEILQQAICTSSVAQNKLPRRG